MRTHFWNTLLSQLSDAQVVQDIGAAWLAGILFRYGTPFDAGFPGMLGAQERLGFGIDMLDGLVGQYYAV